MSIRIAKGMRASFTNFEVVSAHETPALLERRTDCHEVLNDVNRLYADIDGKVDVCEEAEFWEKDAQTREEVERLLSGGWKYCLMTASSYEIRKISWRFVILDKAVTKKHNKHIIMGLSKEAMFPEGVAFDTGVYGANRKMRMLGSSKDNENRPLKLVKGTPMDTLISYIPDGVETEEFVEEKKPVGRPSKVKNALLQKVLENTAIHRIETYEDWIQIGIICFNSGVDVEMWDVVSRRGKNYKAGECEKKWRTFTKGTLGIGRLWEWMQEDSPDVYERLKLVDSSILINDAYAATAFAELMGDSVINDKNVIYVFDATTGMWSCEEYMLRKTITACGQALVWRQQIILGVHTYDYSGSVKNTANLIVKLPDVLPRRDGFMLSKRGSDIGKLLFPNGIYDFKTDTFTEGFDKDIVFFHAMPRPFRRSVSETHIAEVRHVFFEDTFSDDINADVLLHSLMRASIGDYLRRAIVLGLGLTGSGKGLLVELVKATFGTFCSTFNGNSLLSRTGTESAKENSWMLMIANTRLAFSSEIKLRDKEFIDGNTLKVLASGGDEITARRNYHDEMTFCNMSTMFIFANKLPVIVPVDDAIRDRAQSVQWGFSYVNEPSRPEHKKRDVSFKQKFTQPEYCDAFFWLLVGEYKKWQENGYAEPAVSALTLQQVDDIMPKEDYDYAELLADGFVITKNASDKLLNDEIFEYLAEKGVKADRRTIGICLTAMGLKSVNTKVKGMQKHSRVGIRRIN